MTDPDLPSSGPMFSVVMALYNKGRHIERTLSTVLTQTERDFEVVVVDDGSTDDGPARVSALTDPRVRLIRQANGGVSSARNAGIREAKGDWVVFLDADDLQHPVYLQVLRRLAAAQPEARMVATGSANVAEGQEFRLSGHSTITTALDAGEVLVEAIDDLPRRWTEGPCFNASSVAVKRDLLLTMQPCFALGESHGEDLDLWFRVAERTGLAFCPWPLIGRLVDPSGLSSQAAAREEPPFAARMEARAREGQCPQRLRASSLRYVSLYRIFLARTAVVCGRRGLGLKLLWRARRAALNPRWLLTLILAAMPRPLAHRIHRWRVDAGVPS